MGLSLFSPAQAASRLGSSRIVLCTWLKIATSGRIRHAQNHCKTSQKRLDDSSEPSCEYTAHVFNDYPTRLKKSNALDFDDLLIKAVELFDKFPPAAEKYSTRFPYLLVDEYQDTT